MLVCAAAATRNDDGSCGSAPVSVTLSSAARSPPAEVQRSARIARGLCMEDSLKGLATLSPLSSPVKADGLFEAFGWSRDRRVLDPRFRGYDDRVGGPPSASREIPRAG